MQTAIRRRVMLAGRFLLSAAKRRHVQGLTAIFLLALALRLYGANFGLPGEAHPDEPFFVRHALRFGQGDPNPHWFLYPTLYMYILFGLYGLYFVFGYLVGTFHTTFDFAAAYFTDPTGIYILGRSTTALLGAATVVPLYLTGSRLFSRRAGLLAALFLAVTFLHVQHSHFVKSDVPMTFLTTLAVYFAVRVMEEGRTRWYVLAGLAAGLGISTKYNAFPIVAVLASAHLLHAGGGWRGLLPALGEKRIYVGAAAVVGGFLVGTPYALLDFSTFYPFITGQMEQGRVGWVGIGGYTPWVSVITDFLRDGMGVYLLAMTLAGLLYGLLYRRSRGDLLIGSFVLVYFIIIGSSQLNFPRYWLPLIPPLVLLGGRLLDDMARRWPMVRPELQGATVVLAVLLLTAVPMWDSLRYDYLIAHKDTAVLATEWIEANIPSGSRIATTLYGPKLSQTREAIQEEFRLRLEEAESVSEARSVKQTPPESVETKALYYEMLLKVLVSEPSYYAVRQTSVANEPLEYYQENGFEYLVVNASIRNTYLKDRDKYPNVAAFYDTLDTDFELVQEFWPNKTDRPGSGIIIYRLP